MRNGQNRFCENGGKVDAWKAVFKSFLIRKETCKAFGSTMGSVAKSDFIKDRLATM